MRTSLIFLFFPVLFATGACLQCEHCSSSSDTCTSAPHICALNENACITMTMEIITGKMKKQVTYKGCTKSKYCPPTPLRRTVPSHRSVAVSKCCRKDLCNKGKAKLPKLTTRPNGLTCPGCYSKESKICASTELIKCYRREDKCIYFTGHVTEGGKNTTFIQRGCGNKIACINKPRVFGVPGLYMETLNMAECTPAPKIEDK